MFYIYLIRKWSRELSRYQISLYATNASFYIILSVFPTIMLMVALLPTFGIGAEELLDAMIGVVPELLHPLFHNILRDMEGNASGFLLSATALVAIWSASKGVYCIRQGLNAIYGLRERRSYLWNRVSSIVYTLLLILALLLTLVANGFGRSIASYLSQKSIPILKLFTAILEIRGVVLMLVLACLFTAMYCIFPDKKQRIRFCLPGGILAALCWLLFTEGYSLYAKFSGSYSLLYGSISIIAMGMIWLYTCISILFYGCVLNLYIERK